jgi:TonB family protein
VAPGRVLEQILPDVPRSASNTIRGTVRVTVKVRVDPAGNVSAVDLVSPGPSRYFARLSSEAAQRWKFAPATRVGQPVASAWTLRFEYTRTDTRAIPALDVR